MKTEFLNYISEKRLCSTKDKILLAVSGGLDSMVMLHLFRECSFKISVAHVNFQLRGKESDGDELFVKEFCVENSISFFANHFDTLAYAAEKSLSTQMAARELRYQWFDKLIQEHSFNRLATAHHLNDSIETALLNLVRGSGLEGLDGISSKNGNIIRPLLFATRERIEAYAKENNIAWREDSSNASDDYQRNLIRHKVVPLLKELNPSLENSFSESMEKISGAAELMAMGIAYWKEKFVISKGDQIHLDKKGIESEGILWNLIKSDGFNLDQCRQIIKSLHGQSGKKFSSSDFELIIDRDDLIISKMITDLQDVYIEEGQIEAHMGKHTLRLSETKNSSIPIKATTVLLNISKLQFPLRWRKWKAGDFFYPLGMNHKKKLSDFLIDQKISVAEKETVTVLESGNEIVWVVGYRISEKYKSSESEGQILLTLS
ncbi:tRNA(Ile)-lysidine synthase [Cytophagales bacterium WSM2-2]|nr:tRNA(Ile)-lysidine synthase [Cytophagales bacterium WSM2-2]